MDVLAFLLFAHMVVVQPPPSMAYDLMAFFDKSVHEFGILLKPADHSQNAGLDVELAKNTQETPTPDSRAVFEDGLDDRTTCVLIRRKPDVGQHMFGCGVAFEDAAFAAGLDVQIEIDRDPGVARPLRVRWMSSVAFEIAAWAEITAPWPGTRRALPPRI